MGLMSVFIKKVRTIKMALPKDTVRTVIVQMLDITMKKIERLHVLFKNNSRSDTVKMSIDLAHIVAKAWERGDEVILIDKDGNEKRITLVNQSPQK